jgi:single-strand DNA-binding protein
MALRRPLVFCATCGVTAEGKSQVSVRVAVNSRRRGQDGENVERTDWFRARVMGAKADYVSRFHKGQRVLVIGRLEIGEWQTREGETRVSYYVWADDVMNLSRRDEGLNGSNSPAETSARPTAANRQPGGMGSTAGDPGEDLDELPF